MIEKIKLYIIIFLVIFLCNGCVYYGVNVDINSDKSMNYSINFELKKSFYDAYYSEGQSAISEDEKSNLEKNGFKIVENVNSEKYSLSISKEFDNIDDISKENKDVIHNVRDYDSKYFFSVKKSLFKNKYKANVLLDLTDYIKNEDSKYDNNYTIEYVLKLPNESIDNNASDISLDGKTLRWIADFGQVNKFEYSFELENRILIVLKTIIKVVCIIFIVVISYKLFKKLYDKFYNEYWKYVKK